MKAIEPISHPALTKRQAAVFEFIRDKIENRGYGPTVREIGERFRISSPNGVMCHLKALEKKGLIIRAPNMSRAIQLADHAKTKGRGGSADQQPTPPQLDAGKRTGRAGGSTGQISGPAGVAISGPAGAAISGPAGAAISGPAGAAIKRVAAEADPVAELPLVGRVAAGVLHEAIEQQETINFGTMFARQDQFVLEVRGDSMIDAQIADGDYVIVRKQSVARPGQMVVAQTSDGEATLKYWFPEAKRIRLQPANASMQPIYVTDAHVLGVVVGVVRKVD